MGEWELSLLPQWEALEDSLALEVQQKNLRELSVQAYSPLEGEEENKVSDLGETKAALGLFS